jgi:hypothetical protein
MGSLLLYLGKERGNVGEEGCFIGKERGEIANG